MEEASSIPLGRIIADLEQAMTKMSATQLPVLIGALAQVQAQAHLRMLTGDRSTDEMLTVPQVAQRLKLSDYRVYELARQGHIKAIRLGKSVRIRPSAIADYLAKFAA